MSIQYEATSTIKTHVAITKPILKYLNELSIKNEYNRQIAEWLFEATPLGELACIDDRFPIFLKMAIPHKHKQGVECEEHVRTIWEFVIQDDSEQTHTVVVDIPLDAYSMLPDVPLVTNIQEEPMEVWNDINVERLTTKFFKDIDSMLAQEVQTQDITKEEE